MKVVISGYVGKKITGIGRNITSLLENVKSEYDYVIYTNEDMKQDFVINNPNVTIKTYRVSKNNSMGNLLWTTFVFPFVVLKEKADRALIPNFTLLILKFVPTYVIMHDLIEFNIPDKFSKKKMFYRTKLADPITAKRADKIITVSNNSKNDIIKFLNVKEEKITVINNGVDQGKFAPMSKEDKNTIFEEKNWPEKYMLFAGTLDHPGKNAMSVVKVFERLKKEDKYDGKLMLAGMPGKGYDVIEEYINKSEYKEEIIITGYVSDKELIALYSYCDVFCFISLYEGFGIPPLEALSCGAKVVVSNTSSLPEVVGEIGWNTNPIDMDEIEKVVVEALEASKDEEYLNAVKKHLKNFEWKNLGEKFDNTIFE